MGQMLYNSSILRRRDPQEVGLENTSQQRARHAPLRWVSVPCHYNSSRHTPAWPARLRRSLNPVGSGVAKQGAHGSSRALVSNTHGCVGMCACNNRVNPSEHSSSPESGPENSRPSSSTAGVSIPLHRMGGPELPLHLISNPTSSISSLIGEPAISCEGHGNPVAMSSICLEQSIGVDWHFVSANRLKAFSPGPPPAGFQICTRAFRWQVMIVSPSSNVISPLSDLVLPGAAPTILFLKYQCG
jgi:hypothetical protein